MLELIKLLEEAIANNRKEIEAVDKQIEATQTTFQVGNSTFVFPLNKSQKVYAASLIYSRLQGTINLVDDHELIATMEEEAEKFKTADKLYKDLKRVKDEMSEDNCLLSEARSLLTPEEKRQQFLNKEKIVDLMKSDTE
jgi:hypothetical protein